MLSSMPRLQESKLERRVVQVPGQHVAHPSELGTPKKAPHEMRAKISLYRPSLKYGFVKCQFIFTHTLHADSYSPSQDERTTRLHDHLKLERWVYCMSLLPNLSPCVNTRSYKGNVDVFSTSLILRKAMVYHKLFS